MDIKKIEKLEIELSAICADKMFAYINEDSVKRMSEVVRDAFPGATKNEIAACLEMFWEKEDTPETLYKKLIESKVA